MKIGLFDSGLGGLTIMREVTNSLPEYDYIYYGDTANLPYGNRTEAEIYQLTARGVHELLKRDCALVVIACNTASAETLRTLQDEWLPVHYPDRRILGVIVPAVEAFIDTGKKDVLLIATQRTVDSQKYLRELTNRTSDFNLVAVATPELVPLIESGNIVDATNIATQYIEAQGGESEVVILGCTHYTEIKSQLRERFPDKIFLSQDEIIPQKLAFYLTRHPEIESTLGKTKERTIFLTEDRPDYTRLIETFLR